MGGGEGGQVGGFRVNVNEELKFFVKIKYKIKKKIGRGGDRGGGGGFGLVGGQGGCERKIEVFGKIKKKKYIFFFFFFWGGGGGGQGV